MIQVFFNSAQGSHYWWQLCGCQAFLKRAANSTLHTALGYLVRGAGGLRIKYVGTGTVVYVREGGGAEDKVLICNIKRNCRIVKLTMAPEACTRLMLTLQKTRQSSTSQIFLHIRPGIAQVHW
jgi:hypothetical protein